MANEPEVDPDAATVMPSDRREEVARLGGVKVVIGAGPTRVEAHLVSVNGREVVVQTPTNELAVDAEVMLAAATGRPASRATVVWTRWQGSSASVGLALPDDAVARAWRQLAG